MLPRAAQKSEDLYALLFFRISYRVQLSPEWNNVYTVSIFSYISIFFIRFRSLLVKLSRRVLVKQTEDFSYLYVFTQIYPDDYTDLVKSERL